MKAARAAIRVADDAIASAVRELNERLVYLEQGLAEVILFEDDPDYPGTKKVFVRPVWKIGPEYKNQTVIVDHQKNGTPITKTKFEVWLESRRRAGAKGLVMRPGQPFGILPATREFNLWSGWAVKPRPGTWALMREHIREVIAAGDSIADEYIVNWLAYIIQHPEKLPEVSLVLRGSEGTGKGTLAQAVGKLFGRHFLHLTSGQLTARFNDEQKDKVLIFADETFYAGDPTVSNKLKAMITERMMRIEPKNVNAFVLPNYRKFIIASNDKHVVPAGPDARRYAVFEVSDARRDDFEYFKAIYDELEAGGYAAMLHDLLGRDLSEFDPRKFPITAALFDQKKLGFDPITEWWFEKLLDGDSWPQELPRSSILFDLNASHGLTIHDKRGLETKIGMVLKQLCPSIRNVRPSGRESTRRPRVYVLPTLEEARVEFEARVKTEIDWNTGEIRKRPRRRTK
ncbi:MAG TPA: primase-helicase family protein [Steroidobacteraceae bacterium]|nr:primase-helicase family protein [Steroidobacteraceae bacterium]